MFLLSPLRGLFIRFGGLLGTKSLGLLPKLIGVSLVFAEYDFGFAGLFDHNFLEIFAVST